MPSPTNRRGSKKDSPENSSKIPPIDRNGSEIHIVFAPQKHALSQEEFLRKMINIIDLEQASDKNIIPSQVTSLDCFKTATKLTGLLGSEPTVSEEPMAEVRLFPSRGTK